MSARTEQLSQALADVLGAKLAHVATDRGEVTAEVRATDLGAAMRTLRDHAALRFAQLIDVCGVDYSAFAGALADRPRYAAVYHLLSLTKNLRIRVRVQAGEGEAVPLKVQNPKFASPQGWLTGLP